MIEGGVKGAYKRMSWQTLAHHVQRLASHRLKLRTTGSLRKTFDLCSGGTCRRSDWLNSTAIFLVNNSLPRSHAWLGRILTYGFADLSQVSVVEYVLGPPERIRDFVDTEPLRPVMNIAEDPEIVLAVVHPIFDLLRSQWIFVAIGMPCFQMWEDKFVEFIWVNGIRQCPFNDMMMSLKLLGSIWIQAQI